MKKNENQYDELFKIYGAKYNIDWLFLKAQVKAESAFDPNAVSPVGAKGLAQFMAKTWLEWEDETPGTQDLKKDYDPFNPEHAIRVQAAYMNWLKKRVIAYLKVESTVMEWALAAYNCGIGTVQKAIAKNKNYFNAEKTLPLETQGYVIKIMKYYREYLAQLR